MRLFIAIQLNDKMLDALEELQQGMKKCGLRGRYTKRENLHITLAFIGEYGNPDEVLDAMEETDFEEFAISLDGIGSFNDLYYAGIVDGPYLNNLVKRLRRNLAEHHIPFDRKKFTPHITLVRQGEFIKARAGLPDTIPDNSMNVGEIILMKSEHGKNGMIYTVLGGVSAGED